MGRYVIRRLIQFIPVILGTLFLLHVLSTLTIQIVGDPVRALFGPNAPPQAVIEELQARYNLDDSCLDQTGNPCVGLFVDRLGQYATGDFGVNFRGRSVAEMFLERFPVTARLTIIALLFEIIVGITAGVLAGLRKDKFIDNLVRFTTVLLIAFPVFVLGSLTLLFVGLKVGLPLRNSNWAPDWLGQMLNVGYDPDYPWLSLVLPGIVLGAFSLAAIARLTRTSLIENLRSDFVRTARAKGLTTKRTVGIHTLRNSLIPVITYIGIDIGFLLGGSLVTEGIFNIPGVGQLVFLAIQANDAPVIIGVVTILTVVFLISNLLVDILYAALDPRIRYE
ncbi:ABC transporter permease [Nocardioides sp. zg-1230]|uniref:ABC transporter permease n=1 Tax=Nocardioides sp. zg-1230 TaxID=2736601 RepID=UPI001551F99E|nr:ABC transporter permease [Nocardioides sp. zg-1230]NPC43346.1 ABC transporter permease [Nocardioides sp. zg-1230]NPC44750.1 ABC transporter permease [Nocardioides sp. zg-1230]